MKATVTIGVGMKGTQPVGLELSALKIGAHLVLHPTGERALLATIEADTREQLETAAEQFVQLAQKVDGVNVVDKPHFSS